MKDWSKMTDDEKKTHAAKMFYALSFTKQMIKADRKDGGISEFSRKAIEWEIERTLADL